MTDTERRAAAKQFAADVFQSFEIHDMNRPNEDPEVLRLADLEKEYCRLGLLLGAPARSIPKKKWQSPYKMVNL